MSGGSMNYLYSKLQWGADFPQDSPQRVAFAKHLELVAKALHDIEWVDSGDYGPGDEAQAIRACLPVIDCRTCRNYTTASGGCMSVLNCEAGSAYQATTPRQCWKD